MTGELQEFKQGAFTIAERSGAAIIPIVIKGTDQIVRKKEFRAHPGPIDIAIGKPLVLNWDNTKPKKEKYQLVIDQVRDEMLKLRPYLEPTSHLQFSDAKLK